MTAATSHAPPVTDDDPLIEHVARSHLVATWIPPEIFDVSRFAEFCPGCSGYSGLEDLPAYLSVLATVYRNPLFLEQTQYGTAPPPRVRFTDEQRAVLYSSGYLRELFGRNAPADQRRP